eukprot:SAG31_NODE_45277_length_259_cov_0.968750_1_plen_27_part_10
MGTCLGQRVFKYKKVCPSYICSTVEVP